MRQIHRFFLCTAIVGWMAALAQEVEPARFHHVHLNVSKPEETMRFYREIFGATPVRYANAVDALYTERSFLLFNVVSAPAPSALESGIWHIGWGGIDMPNEYEWLKSRGVKIHTPLYPLGNGYVTYVQGPDDELIEVNTTGHHRFGHVHLFAEDVNATIQWYAKHLGLRPRRDFVPKPDLTQVRAWSNGFTCDNVSFIAYGMPNYSPQPPWWPYEPLKELKPSKGRAIDHIAFSYRRIEPVFERMKNEGVEIVEPIRFDETFKHKSFFVLGPDKVLIEIVEAKPVPEGVWE